MKIQILALAALLLIPGAFGQNRGPQQPPVTSPEVSADRKITFRVRAPKAESIQLSGGDIPGLSAEQRRFVKGADDVWEISVGPVAPGAYRYSFNIDGVTVTDPRNIQTSQSNENVWSLVHVPGLDFQDTKDVPHGAIAEVTYWSTSLNRFRRLHVYTPPGYESGKEKYPTFYLLHGASDSDDSWSTVGRAGYILDNLIAAGKARPMVVVMPHGHTGPMRGAGSMSGQFEPEFIADIMPQIEKRYRVHTDRKNRAIAGLSMGGAHTLNIGIPQLDKFAYLGVFSSGIFGITGPRPGQQAPQGPTFAEKHKAILEDAKLKKGLKLFWFATGKDDFLVQTTRATVDMLKKNNFNVVYNETEGAHTWDKWREYLNEFAPQLFR